jgi:UDP-glucose:(heptosyl)LPS alpha-1,3-glucosyltransferase
MKIALVTESIDDSTGLGRIAAALGLEFQRLGHRVHTVGQRNTVRELQPHHRSIPATFSPALNKLALRYLSPSIVRRLDCDIVHSFGGGRKASIVSAQSCHLAGMEIRASVKRALIAERNWGLFDRVALTDERNLVESSHTRRVVAVSELVRTQLLHYYRIEPERITVIPNGVHLERFQFEEGAGRKLRRQHGIPEGAFVLLFIGNEFDRKGLKTIIQALATLRGKSLRLVVAGKADAAPYIALARELGVHEQLMFLGATSGPEQLFPLADVFVFPTVYEPFGMVVIEAMAAGVPVVTTRQCGSVEGMNSGEHGLFLEDALSVEELSAHLLQLLDDASLRDKLAHAGKAIAQRFAWPHIARRFLSVYERALIS